MEENTPGRGERPSRSSHRDTPGLPAAPAGPAADPPSTTQHEVSTGTPELAAAEGLAGPRYVVGIGASAGGLEALTALISNLPVALGACYVVVQHLSPTYRSMLAQLLGRCTEMVVRELAHHEQPVADTVLIAPASRNVTLVDGRFVLTQSPRGATPQPSVNAFLGSLAGDRGENSVAVILSGTGSDGSLGLREIKAAGGFTLAQDPAGAKYSGMPQAALDTGCVDWMLAAEQIAAKIADIVQSREQVRMPTPDGSDAGALKQLLIRVRGRTRVDFSGYKENTVLRRIARRMAAVSVSSIGDYLSHVGDQPAELDLLCQDLLISVTSFFRDRPAFERLAETLKALVRTKRPGDDIRMWVAGCATGEEVYSLAILLSEIAGPLLERVRVQIFATDIDMHAMGIARRGSYPLAALEDVDPDICQTYFQQRNDRYEVIKAVRDMVVFARQDLLLDPPFLRLDLVSCRNVLIYLQSEIQARVLATFHYALRQDGVLFLGRSENIHQQENLFATEDRENRIFRRLEGAARLPGTSGIAGALPAPPVNRATNAELAYFQTAAQYYLPPGVLVNTNLEILHLHGNPGEFLNIGDGRPAFDLGHLILRDFSTDLQGLVRRVKDSRQTAMARPRQVPGPDGAPGERLVRLAVHPGSAAMPGTLLVCFETLPPAARAAEAPPGSVHASTPTDRSAGTPAAGLQNRERDLLLSRVRELEEELVATREHLQTVIEELETSNEEMQALNEEVQAANEELQSSNEELETANEELQSTNEELTTVNEELQVKSSELLHSNAELESVQNGIGFPLMILSRSLRLERFNRPAADLFMLSPALVGAPLSALRLPPGMPDFAEQVEEVILRGLPYEGKISSSTRHYTLYMIPNEIEGHELGVIVLFVDNTDLIGVEAALRTSQLQLMAIMDETLATASLKDPAGRYIYVNRRFCELFGAESLQILGHTDQQLFPRDMADLFRRRDLEVMRASAPLEFEERVTTPQGELELLSLRFPLYGDDGVLYAVCTQAIDISSRKSAERALQLSARVVDRHGEGIVVTDSGGLILYVNRTFERMSGFAVHELAGKHAAVLHVQAEGTPGDPAMWTRIRGQGWWEGAVSNLRKDGGTYVTRVTVSEVLDDQGGVIHYVATFPDPRRVLGPPSAG